MTYDPLKPNTTDDSLYAPTTWGEPLELVSRSMWWDIVPIVFSAVALILSIIALVLAVIE